MNIEELTLHEKVNLLKELIDDLDIVVTGAYGATGFIRDCYLNEVANEHCLEITINTVVIDTNICTG